MLGVTVINACYLNSLDYIIYIVSSGVTTRGEVRQLPQGAERQGALWADGLFALLLNF